MKRSTNKSNTVIPRRKTVLIHSNFCKLFTGFGKNKKNILRYLWETGKYEVVELANGLQWDEDKTKNLPWRCIGSMPPPSRMSQIQHDENAKRAASYGAGLVDKAVAEVKPDIYLGIEDIWAFGGFWNRPWWKIVNPIIWTTLDSLPILPDAVCAAPAVKNYFVWASFAEKAFKAMGYDHVKTLHGSVETDHFFRLDDEKRKALREKYRIDADTFVIGFVFRNQLRKTVPNLLDGFVEFKKNNPSCKAKLLLHTHWAEGWDIPRLLREKGISFEDVLTTYVCHQCRKYEIKKFSKEGLDCPYCGAKGKQGTTNISAGVSEIQLNEIYNLMDVYCHPFTSGGQELPLQEAKLTELITLTTNYSCGEDSCSPESFGLPLEWSEYREPGTQFIKASTYPSSIAAQLQKVFDMTPEERSLMGAGARKYVLDTYSVEVIGKKLEEIFDALPFVNWEGADLKAKPLNEGYNADFSQMSNEEFVINLYENIMHETVDKNHTGVVGWVHAIDAGLPREELLNHFRSIAHNINAAVPIEFATLLDGEKKNRLAVVLPHEATDVVIANSFLSPLQEKYPDHKIYFFTKPENFPFVEDHLCVYKCLPWAEVCDNIFWMGGKGPHVGYFDKVIYPHACTQRFVSYLYQ